MTGSTPKKHSFSNLGVSEALCNALTEQRISNPTPIQAQAIPTAYSGKDIIAQAQTGTGKTLAFLLPFFDIYDPDVLGIQGLIITPTRELAIQITAEARKLSHFKKLNILAAYGGQDIEAQTRKLKGNIQLVIGTPGRILDHMRRKNIALNHVRYLVLDEADQMLHMGFLADVEAIISQTPRNRQTMCFSATMPQAIKVLANRYMNVPVPITIKSEQITLKSIQQKVIITTDRQKQSALIESLRETNPFMAIIFCRTKRRVTTLLQALHGEEFKCDELHGDLSQSKREQVMRMFRSGKVQLLVATDVAARGLDIDGITHVYHYDIAGDAESYIHRMGRTGRAGQSGVSITFATPKDHADLVAIEKGIGMTLSKTKHGGDHAFHEPKKKLPRQLDRHGNAKDPLKSGKGRFDKTKPVGSGKGKTESTATGRSGASTKSGGFTASKPRTGQTAKTGSGSTFQAKGGKPAGRKVAPRKTGR